MNASLVRQEETVYKNKHLIPTTDDRVTYLLTDEEGQASILSTGSLDSKLQTGASLESSLTTSLHSSPI